MAYLNQQPLVTSRGYCDSFFAESDDDDEIYAMRAEARERARVVARTRQREMAEDLSQMTREEYEEDILDHMENMETETMPDVNSIDIQTEIQWFMRPYLLDFLIEAHHAFQLLPETLFLAVNLLDRYCSRRVVYKRHYQLVGCAALLIAAKYGDRKERVPTIRELKSMCCALYDHDMFTQMEWHVLQTLKWIIGHPTVDSFLQIAIAELPEDDPEVEHMSLYICEIALYHKEFVSVRPSTMARSALALSRCILARPQPKLSEWAARYDSYIVYNLSQRLRELSQVLGRKYASMHLSAVSITVEGFLRRQEQLRRYASPISSGNASVEQSLTVTSYMNPQTPQKGHFQAAVPAGVLTPPITPDKDFGSTFGNIYGLPSHLSLSTSTPPPSAEHAHQYNYQFVQPPPQWVQ
ncbi:hypothetical protein LTR60_002778 [Cryomyces antarcticus]|nr:hypothetical protein LTR60_002778 [Cryomyces antarcticus]